MSTFEPVDNEHIGKLIATLRHRGLTLSVAESCTGGLLGASLTAVPGSSAVFGGGVIAYSNSIKERVLGVDQQLLEEQGAVSAPVAEAMAQAVARLMQTDCALSVSGVAGPGGGSPQKPVGLVYLGLALPRRVQSFRHLFDGDRGAVRAQSVTVACDYLLDALTHPGLTDNNGH